MSLITALTTHIASAAALIGAITTVLALSGIAVLWGRATEKHAAAHTERPR